MGFEPMVVGNGFKSRTGEINLYFGVFKSNNYFTRPCWIRDDYSYLLSYILHAIVE